MRCVPADRLGETLIERDPWMPIELVTDLRPIQNVPTIVPGSVGDDRLQVCGLPELGEDAVRDLLDALLNSRTNVVRLSDSAPLEHGVDRSAMVEGVDPLAPILGRLVHLKRLIVER